RCKLAAQGRAVRRGAKWPADRPSGQSSTRQEGQSVRMAQRHHHQAPHDYSRAFALGVGLNVVYIVVETIYGLVVNSLALLADAGHNLSDVLGLLLAWGAYYISRLRPTQRRTYGWRSSSILAALLNGLLLLVAVGGIGWEAIERLWHPEAVVATTVVWVAALGVVVN